MTDGAEGTGGSWRWTKLIPIALVVALIIAAASIGLRAMRSEGADETGTANGSVADVETMIARLEARLQKEPGDAEGWRTLGWSHFQAGRYAAAAVAYERAAALLPDRADLWSALGEARTLAANAVDARAHAAFARALAIDARDARARYFLGVEKDVAGDHKGAVDDWIALLADAPADAPFAQSVRELVVQVAGREGIDVTGRLPASAPATVAGGSGGRDVASAGIPGPTQEDLRAAASLSPSQQDAMARGMVDGLAARLAQNPGDADGWIRLMRARMVLGEAEAAGEALATARRSFAGDAATRARLDEAARTLAVPGA